MQVLTPTGYVDINDLNIGDEVLAYDINDGHLFTNILEGKTQWTPTMFPAIPPVYETDEEGNIVYDEDGNPVVLEPGKTSEQVFQETYGDWKFYKVNNTWTLFCNQSIWANMSVTHASQLQVGDVIYDDQDQDVVITSIEEVEAPDWWRLDISGDHSFIADGLTLHNASRYWVGGGSNSNWNATANTNWGSTSGGANNASVPTSADDVIFDGAGVNGNTNSTISAEITILSLNITTGYTATMTHNALLNISGNWTYTSGYTIAGASGINIGQASTITSNGVTWPNALSITASLNTVHTIVGNLTVGGLFTVGFAAQTFTTTTGGVLILQNGIQVNYQFGSGSFTSVDIYLRGGTWSGINVIAFTNLYLQGNVTLSGVVTTYSGSITYLSGVITTTGSSLNLQFNTTLNTNGVIWNNIGSVSGAKTITLTSNLSMIGVFTVSLTTTINTSVGATWTTSGGISVGAARTLSGTAKIVLTGGTWSAGGSGSSISNNLDIAGNITIGAVTAYTTGVLTYVSGTVTFTGGVFYIVGSCTLNTNGLVWENLNFNVASTVTLTSNLAASTVYVNQTVTLNKTTSETLTISGGFSVIGGFMFGTADIYLTGGTWSGPSQTRNNVFIQGNVTFGASVVYQGGTMTYVSGTVTTTGSTLTLSSTCTLNTNGIVWNNLTIVNNLGVITFTSNFTCTGLINNTGQTTFNTPNSSTVTTSGGLTNGNALSGTAKIILAGGTWSGNNPFSNNLDIAGNVTVSGTVLRTGGTTTYVSGTVTVTGSTINFQNACTVSTGGMVWNNLGNNSSTTVTLTSNLFIGGSFTTSGGTVPTIAFNSTSTEFIFVSGGMSIGGAVVGTAPIYLTAGTWTASTYLGMNLFIQGNITISGNVYYRTGTLKYVSGTVITTGSTLNVLSNLTIDTNGMTWANLNNSSSSCTITLLSNFSMTGLLTTGNANDGLIINTSVGSTFTVGGGINVIRTLSGTAKVILTGGTWSGTGTITSNLDIAGNPTISGNVNYATGTLTYISGTVTVAGSTLSLTGSCTMNTGTMFWGNVTILGVTTTLTSAFNIGGLLSIPTTSIINTSNSSIATLAGGMDITAGGGSPGLSGTASLYWTGGTWTAAVNAAIANNLFINGNVTVSGSVCYRSGTMTYLSGVVTTTGSSLRFTISGCTLNTNGIVWNNSETNSDVKTITLTSNFNLNGSFTVTGAVTVNSTTSETLSANGISLNSTFQGTAKVVLTGGTWSGSGNLATNLDINGNVAISGDVTFGGSNLTYLSGVVNTDGSSVTFGATTTISSGNIIWGGVRFLNSSTKTIVGNLVINRLFLLSNYVSFLNRTTTEVVICLGGFILQNSAISGTADIYVKGGVINCQSINNYIYSNLYIDGNVTLSGIVSKSGGTLQYLSGKVINNRAVLHLNVDATVLGFDKVPIDAVVCVGFATITMDNFFVGTPQRPCRITSNTSDTLINFQDGFEKIARFVNISNIRISRPMQLLVVNNNRFNSNSANTTPNLGIRYINQSPNGAPKNNPSIEDTMTVPALGLINDPCFQYP